MDDRVVRIAARLTEPVQARESVAPALDLCYSPLDGGYFFQTVEDGWRKVSVTYETREDALAARNHIDWDDEGGVTYANEDEWEAWWRSDWGIEIWGGETWAIEYDNSSSPVSCVLMIECW